jgi:hypothetical protein
MMPCGMSVRITTLAELIWANISAVAEGITGHTSKPWGGKQPGQYDQRGCPKLGTRKPRSSIESPSHYSLTNKASRPGVQYSRIGGCGSGFVME